MSEPSKRGINRQGLDVDFEAEERRKSNMLLEAQRLRAQGQPDEAAVKLAEAAEVEEHLGRLCESKGLFDKAWVHHFSALSCWAQAGNFHNAIQLGEQLRARADLPQRLRQRIHDYVQIIRARRALWSAELVAASTDE
jgi:hypothetical protein